MCGIITLDPGIAKVMKIIEQKYAAIREWKSRIDGNRTGEIIIRAIK